MEFHLPEKKRIEEDHEHQKKVEIREASPPPLRDFRNIQDRNISQSPEKQAFKNCKLRENCDPERRYMFDIRKVASPNKITREAKATQSAIGTALAKSQKGDNESAAGPQGSVYDRNSAMDRPGGLYNKLLGVGTGGNYTSNS